MLASINGTDISAYIQESTYKMNQENVYEEWEDASHYTHREQLRTRVVGSFELVFVQESDLTSFLTLMNNNMDTNKRLTISVFVSNINAFNEYVMFADFESISDRSISNSYFYKRFSLALAER